MKDLRKLIKTTIREYLNENKSGNKTILSLIFNENEVSELYNIKEKISINYLRDLDIDPFSNQDEEELIKFIKNSFNKKGISVDEYDMKNILNLISNNIRI